jgi:ribosome biogenesis protein Tsr3
MPQEVEVSLFDPFLIDVYQDEQALIAWRNIANSRTGLTVNELSEFFQRNYPVTLIIIKKLLKAKVVCRIGDRFLHSNIKFTSDIILNENIISENIVDVANTENNGLKFGNEENQRIPIYVIFPSDLFGYDNNDAEKCTAVRMIKANLAQQVNVPPQDCILLDPCADEELQIDKDLLRITKHGICLIDAPWYMLPEIMLEFQSKGVKCFYRRLNMPLQNNSYYKKSTQISTAGAASYVTSLAGFWTQATEIANLFEWGEEWLCQLKSFLIDD